MPCSVARVESSVFRSHEVEGNRALGGIRFTDIDPAGCVLGWCFDRVLWGSREVAPLDVSVSPMKL
jgi:hypothetical protein